MKIRKQTKEKVKQAAKKVKDGVERRRNTQTTSVRTEKMG